MAISIPIYSNVNTSSRSISIDFVGDFLVLDEWGAGTATFEYFFKVSTGSRDMDNATYPTIVVTKLSDLALNKTKQSAEDSGTAYANVRSMIMDYVYDFIHGHTANQYTSGCTYKAPMKFT